MSVHTKGNPSVFERILEVIEENPTASGIILVHVPPEPVPGHEVLTGEILAMAKTHRHLLRSPVETKCGITAPMLPDGVVLHIACDCGRPACGKPVTCPMCKGEAH